MKRLERKRAMRRLAMRCLCAAPALMLMGGCNARNRDINDSTAEESIPESTREGEELMLRLDRDLRNAGVDEAAGAIMRERMRGRLLSAGLSHETIDSWVGDAGTVRDR